MRIEDAILDREEVAIIIEGEAFRGRVLSYRADRDGVRAEVALECVRGRRGRTAKPIARKPAE